MTPRGIGDNGGPSLDPDPPDPGASWRLWCWKRAHKRAWKTPPREIALRRLANAEARGMSYREYTLEIMERGVHLGAPDAAEESQAVPSVSSPAASAASPVPSASFPAPPAASLRPPASSPRLTRGSPSARSVRARKSWMAALRRP